MFLLICHIKVNVMLQKYINILFIDSVVLLRWVIMSVTSGLCPCGFVQ